MDSFELNKIMGAVLGTLLFVMGAGFVAEAIYHPIEDRGPGYALPEPEPVAEAGAEEAAPEVDLGTLLAAASVERGAAAVRKCQSCHNFGEGEPNKTGPGLFGVVGRLEGSHEGFSYSDAMAAHGAAGDTWTFENLNHFLTSPKDYAPGTKMTFAGVRSAEERADILAYLQTLSADPVPFPAPAAAAPADAAAAPAEGAAPAEEAAPAAEPAPQATTPSDPAAAAPENAAEPQAPAEVVETPTETQDETAVEGTPIPGAAQPTQPAPATPAPATPAPAGEAAPAAPAQ